LKFRPKSAHLGSHVFHPDPVAKPDERDVDPLQDDNEREDEEDGLADKDHALVDAHDYAVHKGRGLPETQYETKVKLNTMI